MKPMKFAEAFKKQLDMVSPLSEAALTELQSTPQTCRLSNEPFVVGDEIMYVLVPSEVEESDYDLIACKKAVLESKNFEYTDDGGYIPKVSV